MLKPTIKDFFHRNMYSPDCDLRDALLDAVGGGGDDRLVKASLLFEHSRQSGHVSGQHSSLYLETEESNR